MIGLDKSISKVFELVQLVQLWAGFHNSSLHTIERIVLAWLAERETKPNEGMSTSLCPNIFSRIQNFVHDN